MDVSIFTVVTANHRDIDHPITCQLSPVERISSRSIPGQVKVSGSYVNSFYARRLAEAAGFDDGVMFDRQGQLAEASAANIFVIRGERLITPPLNPDVFPGITRQTLIEIAHAEGIDLQEENITCDQLRGIDGAFLCSTLMEVRGISRLGEHILNTIELPVYTFLVAAFRGITHS